MLRSKNVNIVNYTFIKIHTQYFGFYGVPNGAYLNVESVHLEKFRKKPPQRLKDVNANAQQL